MTDDKSLRKLERKRLQVEHTVHISDRAKLIKIADKTFNVREAAVGPEHRVGGTALVAVHKETGALRHLREGGE